jgi:uncharacterized protein (DUF488 family)
MQPVTRPNVAALSQAIRTRDLLLDNGARVIAIYTIGHSSHEADAFVALLRQHGIQIVVDVRSSPYSRYVPQANRDTLAHTLEAAGIAYHWMGRQLGGKPPGVAADYDQLRARPAFHKGLATLLGLAEQGSTAIMCAEGDHRRCHRTRLIAPALLDRDVRILHIQTDGSLVEQDQEPRQLSFF